LRDLASRFDGYKSRQFSLTSLGKAILAGADDFSRHNPIDRWWGGTHLTNDRLWRWETGFDRTRVMLRLTPPPLRNPQ
jgi:hypothetical protein